MQLAVMNSDLQLCSVNFPVPKVHFYFNDRTNTKKTIKIGIKLYMAFKEQGGCCVS